MGEQGSDHRKREEQAVQWMTSCASFKLANSSRVVLKTNTSDCFYIILVAKLAHSGKFVFSPRTSEESLFQNSNITVKVSTNAYMPEDQALALCYTCYMQLVP